MNMFTVVPFVRELKGKQASPAPPLPAPISACLLLTTELGTQGPRAPAGTTNWVARWGRVWLSHQENPPECETTAIPSNT